MGERARNFHDILWVGQQPQPDPTNFLVLKHFTVNTLLRNVLKSCLGTWKNIYLSLPQFITYCLKKLPLFCANIYHLGNTLEYSSDIKQ